MWSRRPEDSNGGGLAELRDGFEVSGIEGTKNMNKPCV